MKVFLRKTSALVFGRQNAPGSGNAATVVWCNSPPSNELLAEIARREGTPITAFLIQGTSTQVRFFTPYRELPFCGHGALAAGAAEALRQGCSRISLMADSRNFTVNIASSGLATLILPGPGSDRVENDQGLLLDALKIETDALADYPAVHVASVGSPKWLVEMRNIDILRSLQPDMSALVKISHKAEINGVYAFTRRDIPSDIDALARGFNPLGGIGEDAATGIAVAAIAWLWRTTTAGRWIVVDQGIGVSNLNRLLARVEGNEIHVGGNVVF